MKEAIKGWFAENLGFIATMALCGVCLTLVFLGVMRVVTYIDAKDFVERTGITAECNIVGSCYVKPDSVWIPYKVWVRSQPVNHVELINFGKKNDE